MTPALDSRGGALLDVLRREPATSQRRLARAARLSLGSTNKLLRRLEESGCLLIEGGKRHRRYVVTPKGLTERSRSAYVEAAEAVRDVAFLEKTVQVEVLKAYAHGTRAVAVVGGGPLCVVASRAVLDLALPDLACSRAASLSELPTGDRLALADEPSRMEAPAGCRVRLIGELLSPSEGPR